MPIPIENIYYLLGYAWNRLDEKDRVAVSVDDRTELVDLFAKILINSTRILLKRGIDRNYVVQTAEFSGIKGKLELAETLKRNLQMRFKTVCSYDEFSADILINRILVSTLKRLIKTTNLDSGLKHDIRKLLPMFGAIETVALTPAVFAPVRLNRNNRFYGFVLEVCRIIAENILPSEKSGEWKFVDFTRDEYKMRMLFEAFIRNFYKIEQRKFAVRREDIRWQLATSEENRAFLPKMQTDITLESESQKIILDAKFYKETFKTHRGGAEKIASDNLYQLFSYLLNQRDNNNPKTCNAAGILVYPTIEKDYDLEFQYQSHRIFIKTLNLNTNWQNISRRLKNIIQLHKIYTAICLVRG